MSTVAVPAKSPARRLALRLTPERQLLIFVAIVLAHWVEHVAQAVEYYALGMGPAQARGGLGLVWPWLVTTEALHYAYAVVMLAGLAYLRRHFDGPARTWWNAALALQVWHHVEHLLLLGQAVLGHPLFGADKPTSIVQLVIPRIELHLFYNGVVFTPMVVAMYLRHRSCRARGDSRSRRPAAAPR